MSISCTSSIALNKTGPLNEHDVARGECPIPDRCGSTGHCMAGWDRFVEIVTEAVQEATGQ